MNEDYRPRAHDHLVEPMFGGLGMEREARAAETDPPSLWRRLWIRLVALLRRRGGS